MIYDAHTHLNADRLYENRQEHYQAFVDKGGQGIITVGMDPKHNKRAIEIAQATVKNTVPVKITVGIHPYEVGNGSVLSKKDVDTQIQEIREHLENHKEHIVAIGEGGIDAHYDGYETRKNIQFYAFEEQCKLAREYGLPIVIHSRDQFDDTFAIIKKYADLKVYYHCYGYGAKEIEILIEMFPNLRLGFCGNVTYPKAHVLREGFAKARELQAQGKCHVLFETDAPYLTPQQRRGTLNCPEKVSGIYAYLSEEFCIEIEKLQEKIKENFMNLYF